MSDKEVALELTKIGEKQERRFIFESYKNNLQSLRELRLDDAISKIEELIDDYDGAFSVCDYTRTLLIDNIRKIVKGDN